MFIAFSWYRWYRAHRIFATGHNCKPTCVQGNFAKADSLSADQKKRLVWKQRLAASSRQRSSHNALSIRQFLTEWNVTMLDQPPYSPDLAPCDFFYFQNWKASLKELIFQTWKQWKGLWRWIFGGSPKKPSVAALKGGKNEWKSELHLEEITLKGESLWSRYSYYNKIFMTSVPLLLRHTSYKPIINYITDNSCSRRITL